MIHTLHIEVSDETLAALRRDATEYASELRIAAAAKLYEVGRVSQEVAAEIAGLNRADFLLALAQFGVSPSQDTREFPRGRARAWLSAGSSTPRRSSRSGRSRLSSS